MDSSVNISLAEPEQTMPISILFECVKINVLASQGCQNGYKVKVSHFWIFNCFFIDHWSCFDEFRGMTHQAGKVLTTYVTVKSAHRRMSVLITSTLIDAAVNLFPFFPMNLLWAIFLCFLGAVYIWPFPSKCIYVSFYSKQKKVCFKEKVPHRFSLPSASHHRMQALHEGMMLRESYCE